MKTQPLVNVLSKPNLYEPSAGQKMELHCNHCYLLKPVQRCSGCKGVYYCCGTCQQADWPAHKTECKALTRVRQLWVQSYPEKAKDGLNNSWIQADGARALGLLTWARKAYRDQHGRDPDYWPKVEKMYAEGPDMGTGVHGIPATNQMALHLNYYVGAAEPPTDPNNLELIDMEPYGFQQDEELMRFVRSVSYRSREKLTPVRAQRLHAELVRLEADRCRHVPSPGAVQPQLCAERSNRFPPRREGDGRRCERGHRRRRGGAHDVRRHLGRQAYAAR